MTTTLASRLSAKDDALQCAEQTATKCPFFFQFSRLLGVQSTFMSADRFLQKFNVLWNSNIQTYCGWPLVLGCFVVQVESIYIFSSCSTLALALFFLGISSNKRCKLLFFSCSETLISTWSSLLIFPILNRPWHICRLKNCCGCCHLIDGNTLFSEVDSNK